MQNKGFAKYININGKFKPFNDERDIIDLQNKEIERLNNIINKINKLLECDTHCENIYYAIGVLLNYNYFDIEDIENKEILNILKEGK